MMSRFGSVTLIVFMAVESAYCEEFTTKPAQDALAEYERNVREAREAFETSLGEARAVYSNSLDEAAKTAVDSGQLEEVVRIQAAKKSLENSRAATRRLWVHPGGFYQQLHDGRWFEQMQDGKSNMFVEVDRNDQFVEMRLSGGIVVRLFGDHAVVKFPGERAFRDNYQGGWVE